MLTIQFGQCGNQLGYNLFSKISADLNPDKSVSYNINYEYSENTIEKWFDGVADDGRRFARAILVDTEKKVINKIRKDLTTSWLYRPNNVVCDCGDSSGSANNWAYGYGINGDRLSGTLLNVTRQQVEKLDCFQGFLLLLSSAGGTGAGVGSRIIEHLREEYKTKPIVATIVLPFSFGEVCIQNYNTMLTLAKIYDKADLSVLFKNNQVYAMCTNLLKNSNAALYDMNNIIAENLLAVFQPTNDIKHNMNFLVSNIAAYSNFKFATIESTPYVPTTSLEFESTHKWDVYIRHLKHTLQASMSQMEQPNIRLNKSIPMLRKTVPYKYNTSVSNILITRGNTIKNDVIVTKDLQEKYLYPDWITLNSFIHMHQKRRMLNRNKFLTLITNNSKIHQPLDIYLDKAWNSYKCSAFLHQYKQFGWEKDDFLQAFAKVENIIQEYKNLKSYN